MADNVGSIRSLLSVIRAGGNDSYPYSAGSYEIPEFQSLPSGVLPVGDPACLSGAPEVQYHLSATLRGHDGSSEVRRVLFQSGSYEIPEFQSLPSGVLPVGDPACLSGAPEVQYHLSATLRGHEVRTSSGAQRHSPNSSMEGVSRVLRAK